VIARARLAFALLACAGCGLPPSVDLLAGDGRVVRTFDAIERVSTPEGRAKGLVGHAPLGPREAMVLDYPVVDAACITNAQVDFPIVAVFVASDGAIVAAEALTAHDARVPCHDGVLRVVEIDSGGTRGAVRVVVR